MLDAARELELALDAELANMHHARETRDERVAASLAGRSSSVGSGISSVLHSLSPVPATRSRSSDAAAGGRSSSVGTPARASSIGRPASPAGSTARSPKPSTLTEAAAAARRAASPSSRSGFHTSETTRARAEELGELRSALLTATHALQQAHVEGRQEKQRTAAIAAERDDLARGTAQLRESLAAKDAETQLQHQRLRDALREQEREAAEAQRALRHSLAENERLQRDNTALRKRAAEAEAAGKITGDRLAAAQQEIELLRERMSVARKELQRYERFVAEPLRRFVADAQPIVQHALNRPAVVDSPPRRSASSSKQPQRRRGHRDPTDRRIADVETSIHELLHSRAVSDDDDDGGTDDGVGPAAAATTSSGGSVDFGRRTRSGGAGLGHLDDVSAIPCEVAVEDRFMARRSASATGSTRSGRSRAADDSLL